jgi:hypothetical protein
VLSISLAILPVCAFVAFAIAISGQKYDSRGALIATLAIWLLLSYLVQSAGDSGLGWWTHFFASLMMTSVSMLLIAAPMLAMRTADWNKGRIVVGLVGSVAAALVFPAVALMSACQFLNDCL